MADKLTRKQRQFVNEYLIDLNGAQAAIRAGYSPDTAKDIACENLAKPHLQAEIDRLVGERERRTKLTADYVLGTVHETIERCKQGEQVFDKEGKPTGEWKFEPFAVLKGCELAGKHLRLFTEKIELSGEIRHEFIDVSKLTETQLYELERLVESASTAQSSQPANGKG